MTRGSSGAGARGLLVVYHSRSGSTRRMSEAVTAGAREAAPDLPLQALGAFDAGPDDVRGAGAVILGTPANFGYMSGALKDFLERIYHPCLGETAGLPYSVFVKGDTDVDGAVTSVERIIAGLGWKRALPPLRVVGELREADLEAAWEMGATMAAGLDTGIF